MNILETYLYPAILNGAVTASAIWLGKEWLTGNVKHHFDEKIKYLESELNKNNIGYQIHTSEYTKYKFDKVVKMYISVIGAGNIRAGFKEAVGKKMSDEDALNELNVARKAIWNIQDQLTETSLFISSELEQNVLEFLHAECIALDRIFEICEAHSFYNKFSIGRMSGPVEVGHYVLNRNISMKDYTKSKEIAYTEIMRAESNYDKTILKYAEHLKKLQEGFKAEVSGAELNS